MIERSARRAVLLTPAREVLLICIRDPVRDWAAWITPGGGAEPGETAEQTLRRELHEELGLERFTLGPGLWTRDHAFTWEEERYHQQEEFFLVETERFAPTSVHQPDGIEARAFQRFCWWTLAGVEASDELFVPRRLGWLLRRLVEEGPPGEPFDAGI